MNFPVKIESRQHNAFRLHSLLVEKVYESISRLETIQTDTCPAGHRIVDKLVMHELESVFNKDVSQVPFYLSDVIISEKTKGIPLWIGSREVHWQIQTFAIQPFADRSQIFGRGVGR